jgi:hypothetical protein
VLTTYQALCYAEGHKEVWEKKCSISVISYTIQEKKAEANALRKYFIFALPFFTGSFPVVGIRYAALTSQL